MDQERPVPIRVNGVARMQVRFTDSLPGTSASVHSCDGSNALSDRTLDYRLERETHMAFKDILLTLTSYPDPTPVSVLDDSVSIAATLGADLAAISCEVHVEVPGHFLAGSIANLPGIIA